MTDPSPPSRILFPLSSLRNPGCREVVVETAGDRSGFFVVRQGNQVRAYVNSCPHQRVPLNWKPDTFLTPDLDAIQCSLHRALFRIDDGYCTEGPCAGRSLTPVPVHLEDGMVVLDAPVSPVP